jgi:hypothetical protein
MRVVVLTGSELRHEWFVRALGEAVAINGDDLVLAVQEGVEKSLDARVQKSGDPPLLREHVDDRTTIERVSFSASVADSAGLGCMRLYVGKGAVNSAAAQDAIAQAQPDLLVCYGASLIREPLLSEYAGRFLNLHLGLSPYYRGAGTNVWALIDGAFACVGVTFMHIDAGVDTGEIIHQIRLADTLAPSPAVDYQVDGRYLRRWMPHVLGCSVIVGMVEPCARIIRQWHHLKPRPQPTCESPRVCLQKDFTEDSVLRLRESMRGLPRYLANRRSVDARYPIVCNPEVDSCLL